MIINKIIFSLSIKLVVAISLFSVVTACATKTSTEVKNVAIVPKQFPVLQAVGYAPISLQKGQTEQQRMLQAITASKLDAYRELAEIVHGQKLDAKNNVTNTFKSQSGIASSVTGLIKGAKVVKSYAINDVYITELELDFEQIYQLYNKVEQKQKGKRIRYY